MLYAIKNNKKIQATPQDRAFCPFCKNEVIAKCGQINVWHWAHKTIINTTCDGWKVSESDWHLMWKSLFPPECVEIPIIKGREKHIADVRLNTGRVIEFQSSSLSPEGIWEREAFYGDIFWIFNVIEAYNEYRIDLRNKGKHHSFRWKHAQKSIAYAEKPVFLDFGDGLLLHLQKMYIGPPCGGWGYIKKKKLFLKFLR
jgi:hypothetical protein